MIKKVCGMRSPENILELSALEIDYIGFIFYEKSPRYVGEEPELSSFLNDNSQQVKQKRVGVFVNARQEEVVAKIIEFKLNIVQLHGGESAVYCESLRKQLTKGGIEGISIMRAFRVSDAFDFGITAEYLPHCNYFLFDTKGAAYGGTGHKFNWEILSRYKGDVPFLLSGGIGPDDAEAITSIQHPACVGIDVNSCFELAPALKDVGALGTFFKQLY